MLKYAVGYISFHDNVLKLAFVEATDERDAVAQALNLLTGVEDYRSDVETLKSIAFDCDGMIEATLITD
jgi:hypothetical protein